MSVIDIGRGGDGANRNALKLLLVAVVPLLLIVATLSYQMCRIQVPAGQVAVLVRKTGLDIENSDEIAPSEQHKGVQLEVLREGRYFYNPYHWEWEIVPQFEVPSGKIGVMTRLYGEDLPNGEFLAVEPTQKGILPKALEPGRYPINPYAVRIDLYDPVTVPAGYKGVVTHLAGPMPKNPNRTTVDEGERGVQLKTLDPGTYYLNPFVTRVNLVDCRRQRIDLAEDRDLGFPTKDGFWVSLDGIVEFRVKPEMASEVFVLYNEFKNDGLPDTIDEEIRHKIILPNARSFCRLQGSNNLGREIIQGTTRTVFAERFRADMVKACETLGVEIVDAQITRVRPPDKIAEPLRTREIAKQKQEQYLQQTKQQIAEQELAIQTELVKQKQSIVQATQQVVKLTTEAQQKQQVAVTLANQELAVAKLKLEAAKDEAAAIESRGEAAAKVVQFSNEAEAAGWKQSVAAFDGDGIKFARYVLYQKIAPAYKSIMANTADSPIMDIFRSFAVPPEIAAPNTKPAQGNKP